MFLADDTDDHDVEGSNETTMSCVEGETYRPPQIPDCLESESPYTRSHEVEFSVLHHSGSFVCRQCSVTQKLHSNTRVPHNRDRGCGGVPQLDCGGENVRYSDLQGWVRG